ncbi:MAG TPA: radical SAM protein, partial [Spirochaetota bacterium]
AYFAPTGLDEETFSMMKQSGLTHIEFGTESLSDRTLDAYQKGFTVADVIHSSELCNRYDVHFAHFMILGGYGETEDTLRETFENSKSINNSIFFPFVGMRIYPQTELHRIAIKENIVSEADPLLEPVYYVATGIDMDAIRVNAKATGKKWFFPDEDFSAGIARMRARNKKGLLWEYLIRY